MRPSSSLVLRRSLAFVSAATLLLAAPLLAAQSTADVPGAQETRLAGEVTGVTTRATPPPSQEFPRQPPISSSVKLAGSVDAASAQIDAPKGAAATSVANTAKVQKSEGTTHEGITLYGHWTIDVKNSDGTVAQHRTFENSITNYGQELLVALMSGYAVPSDYGIFLSSTGTAPCAALTGFQGCGIVRSLTTLPGSALCPNYTCATGLTYTTAINEQTGNPVTAFTLAGTMTAGNAGTITGVSTLYGTCPANLSTVSGQTSMNPITCSTTAGTGGYRSVSSATITTVNVAASQIVQVTVTFTFS